ncbi:MAG: SDR family oxidoreductase [Firmicutes bacterium]|nr:SDR family oxidoreductase [Bacillota bacterium]
MDLALRGRLALVTAASEGLGLAAALALAGEGCRVAVCARRPGPLAEARRRLLAAGAPEAWALAADVDDPGQRAAMLAEVEARLGPPDVLVANCGNPAGGWVDEVGEEAWADAWAKARAIVELDRWAAARMAVAGGGAIVNVLSRTAVEPDSDLALSSVVRPALLAWGKMLAVRAGPSGVRVVSVLPGLTRTAGVEEQLVRGAAPDALADPDALAAAAAARQGVPLGRLGTPEAFGRLVAFLASPACDYVSGSAVRFDGGAVRAP